MFGLGQLGRLGLSSGRSLASQIMAMGPNFFAWPSVDGGYQDSAGTTALYAPGGGSVDPPVGLALDKSQGLVLGPELVVNGDFSDGATGWTLDAGWSIADGKATVAVVPYATITQRILEIGKRYLISVESIENGSQAYVQVNGGGQYIFLNPTGVTTLITTVISNLDFSIVSSGLITSPASIDNISVRELPGNHASQATSPARPVLSARKNLLLNTDVLSTQSVTVLASQCVLSFTGTGTVTLTGASTAGPLVGTGAGDRVSLTFTPTAGSLTLTVSGSVTLAQLEYAA